MQPAKLGCTSHVHQGRNLQALLLPSVRQTLGAQRASWFSCCDDAVIDGILLGGLLDHVEDRQERLLGVELGVHARVPPVAQSYRHVVHGRDCPPGVYNRVGAVHAVAQRCRVVGQQVELQQLGVLLQRVEDGLVDRAVALTWDACEYTKPCSDTTSASHMSPGNDWTEVSTGAASFSLKPCVACWQRAR